MYTYIYYLALFAVLSLLDKHFYLQTYIRGQANSPFPAGCSNGSQKMMHAYGTTSVSSVPQCASAVPNRSKLVTIRPVGAAHSFLKSCQFKSSRDELFIFQLYDQILLNICKKHILHFVQKFVIPSSRKVQDLYANLFVYL